MAKKTANKSAARTSTQADNNARESARSRSSSRGSVAPKEDGQPTGEESAEGKIMNTPPLPGAAPPENAMEDPLRDKPTAREGLKPEAGEKPHPSAAARPAKTAQQLTGPAITPEEQERELENEEDTFKVEATQMGYYRHIRRRPGDVFTIKASEFSENWMHKVGDDSPANTTRQAQALRREQEEIRRNKRGERSTPQENPLQAEG